MNEELCVICYKANLKETVKEDMRYSVCPECDVVITDYEQSHWNKMKALERIENE